MLGYLDAWRGLAHDVGFEALSSNHEADAKTALWSARAPRVHNAIPGSLSDQVGLETNAKRKHGSSCPLREVKLVWPVRPATGQGCGSPQYCTEYYGMYVRTYNT